MGGVLYYDENMRPNVGAKVVISVDRANAPTGVWDGELMRVNTDASLFSTGIWTQCTAKITDPHAPKDYHGCQPHVNYEVYVATAGTQYFRDRLNEANIEIRGLKRRMDIERNTLHAALKAIVNAEAFERFRTLLEDFQQKFFERLERK